MNVDRRSIFQELTVRRYRSPKPCAAKRPDEGERVAVISIIWLTVELAIQVSEVDDRDNGNQLTGTNRRVRHVRQAEKKPG